MPCSNYEDFFYVDGSCGLILKPDTINPNIKVVVHMRRPLKGGY